MGNSLSIILYKRKNYTGLIYCNNVGCKIIAQYLQKFIKKCYFVLDIMRMMFSF